MKKGSTGSKRPYVAQNGLEEDQVKRKERQQQQQSKPREALAVKECEYKPLDTCAPIPTHTRAHTHRIRRAS